jgi:hypothetical protein
VLLEKNDRSMSVLLENSSRSSSSFRVATVEATAARAPAPSGCCTQRTAAASAPNKKHKAM